MTTPVLTQSDQDTLHFLQTRDHRSRHREVFKSSFYEERRLGALRMAQFVEKEEPKCYLNPATDEIEYHSETVERGIKSELQTIEAIESDWIAQSDTLARDVFTFQKQLADHWLSVTSPHVLTGMGTIMSITGSRRHATTGASCANILASVRDGVMHSTMWSSQRALNRDFKRFRADSARRPGLQKSRYVVEAAVGNASLHLIRWRLRRQYMFEQHYGEASNAAYYAGKQDPAGIFSLLSNAQGLVANIAAGSARDATAPQQSSLSKLGQAIGMVGTIMALPW